MPTYGLTVNAVSRTIHLPSLDFAFVSNGRDFLRLTINSAAAAYRPTIGHEVILTEDGTDIFGGFIAKTAETSIDSKPTGNEDIATEITCDAFNVYADKVFVTETFTAGTTLEDVLTTLVTNYLADFGVTLSGSQATGPTFAQELVFTGEALSSVLQTLTELAEDAGTGESWLWEISPAKVFQMYEAGSVAAPVNFVAGDQHEAGDIKVVRSRDKYANRVIVKFGPTGVVPYTDSFTGDGTTDTFTLDFPIAPGAGHPFSWAGYVTNGATNETLDVAGFGATWEYDPSNHTITRVTGAPANLNAISINYDVIFPQTVTVEDAGEITANGPHEVVLTYPNVTDQAVATGLATAALAKLLSTLTEVTIPTYQVGLLPGQTTTVTQPARNINADFLITQVSGRSTDVGLLRHVTAVSGAVFRGSFRDVYRAWLGGGTGGVSAAPAAVTAGSGFGGPGATPANPNRSVQFNNSGAFGGSTDFLWQSSSQSFAGFPANLYVRTVDEARYHLALEGPDSTSFWNAQVFGGGDLYWTNGRDYTVQPLRDYAVSAAREIILESGNNFADQIHLRGLASMWSVALGAVLTAATTYEVDVTGATPITVFYAQPTTGNTNIVLPSLTTAAVNPASGQYRVLVTRHDSTANTVRVRPKSTSETINNSSEYTHSPLETVWWGALTGSGAGWKPLARFST